MSRRWPRSTAVGVAVLAGFAFVTASVIVPIVLLTHVDDETLSRWSQSLLADGLGGSRVGSGDERGLLIVEGVLTSLAHQKPLDACLPVSFGFRQLRRARLRLLEPFSQLPIRYV